MIDLSSILEADEKIIWSNASIVKPEEIKNRKPIYAIITIVLSLIFGFNNSYALGWTLENFFSAFFVPFIVLSIFFIILSGTTNTNPDQYFFTNKRCFAYQRISPRTGKCLFVINYSDIKEATIYKSNSKGEDRTLYLKSEYYFIANFKTSLEHKYSSAMSKVSRMGNDEVGFFINEDGVKVFLEIFQKINPNAKIQNRNF